MVEPAFLWTPEHSSTAAIEVVDFAAEIGIEFEPEQRLALDAILAERPDGRWAAFEAALIVSRQNFKTFTFEVIALADIYLDLGSDLIVWSAHEFDVAMEAFRDIEQWIDAHHFLSRRVKKISWANGREGIEFTDRKRLRFKARTKSGGRGLVGDRVILDEGFALQPHHMGSLMPTMSAKSLHGNPQILYGSSAGHVGSSVLRSVRDRGRAGGDPSLVYAEWCDDNGSEACKSDHCDHHVGANGCALDDPERWRQANPMLDRRISREWIEGERRSMPPEEFARERHGWWDEPPLVDVRVPLDEWASCASRDAELVEPVTLGVDVAPNHTDASILACGRALHVVENGKGSSWVPDRLVELAERHAVSAIGLDPSGPAGSLIHALEQRGFTVRSASNPDGLLVLLDGREMSQACEGFLAEVLEHELIHRDEHALNAAVEEAVRKPVGDSWKWSRKDSRVDISPVVAGTVARYLWTEPDRDGEVLEGALMA